jgi:hypothetical protein
MYDIEDSGLKRRSLVKRPSLLYLRERRQGSGDDRALALGARRGRDQGGKFGTRINKSKIY